MARIIFLTDFSEAYARGLLLGIARYAHDSGQAWSLCRLPLSIRDKSGIEAVIDWAQRTRADAVIGQFYNTDNVELFARNGIIAVAQDFKTRFSTIPNITGPHYRAGQMGAEYFLKKGFRHFAFYGTRGIVWSDERYQGFRDTIRAGQSRLLLLRVAEYVADRPVALRSDPADHLAAIAAQAGCNHGLRRQSGLPHNGGLPARRGGGGEIYASRTTLPYSA